MTGWLVDNRRSIKQKQKKYVKKETYAYIFKLNFQYINQRFCSLYYFSLFIQYIARISPKHTQLMHAHQPQFFVVVVVFLYIRGNPVIYLHAAVESKSPTHNNNLLFNLVFIVCSLGSLFFFLFVCLLFTMLHFFLFNLICKRSRFSLIFVFNFLSLTTFFSFVYMFGILLLLHLLTNKFKLKSI